MIRLCEGRCTCLTPLVVCKVMYQNKDGTLDTLFYRQQCQTCGFVREAFHDDELKKLYWTGSFNYDWMNFNVAKDFVGERNGLSSVERKKRFLSKIIDLTNKSEVIGNIVFTSRDLVD